MAAHPQPRITPEQYLELDRASQVRSEYYKGQMYAMAGGSLWHALIAGNFAAELHSALKQRPCLVMPADMRVRVQEDGLYTYPDVVVVCGEPSFVDKRSDTLLNPTLLIEVLSPGTEAHDRGLKASQYRTLPTLQEYVLVSQSEARVEVFRRRVREGDWLLLDSVGLESVCQLTSVDCRVALKEIYAKVSFNGGIVVPQEKVPQEKVAQEKVPQEKVAQEKAR